MSLIISSTNTTYPINDTFSIPEASPGVHTKEELAKRALEDLVNLPSNRIRAKYEGPSYFNPDEWLFLSLQRNQILSNLEKAGLYHTYLERWMIPDGSYGRIARDLHLWASAEPLMQIHALLDYALPLEEAFPTIREDIVRFIPVCHLQSWEYEPSQHKLKLRYGAKPQSEFKITEPMSLKIGLEGEKIVEMILEPTSSLGGCSMRFIHSSLHAKLRTWIPVPLGCLEAIHFYHRPHPNNPSSQEIRIQLKMSSLPSWIRPIDFDEDRLKELTGVLHWTSH